jgi:hypothetical protein
LIAKGKPPLGDTEQANDAVKGSSGEQKGGNHA